MSKKSNVLIVLGVIIVILLGLIAWNSYQSKPEVAYQNEQIAKEKQNKKEEEKYLDKKDKMFKDAPEGHYFTWGPGNSTLYKTTWTKQQIIDAINTIDTNNMNDVENITFGTKKVLIKNTPGGQNLAERQQRRQSIEYYDTLADVEADKARRSMTNKIVY